MATQYSRDAMKALQGLAGASKRMSYDGLDTGLYNLAMSEQPNQTLANISAGTRQLSQLGRGVGLASGQRAGALRKLTADELATQTMSRLKGYRSLQEAALRSREANKSLSASLQTAYTQGVLGREQTMIEKALRQRQLALEEERLKAQIAAQKQSFWGNLFGGIGKGLLSIIPGVGALFNNGGGGGGGGGGASFSGSDIGANLGLGDFKLDL